MIFYYKFNNEFDFEFVPTQDELIDALAKIMIRDQYLELNERDFELVMYIVKGIISDNDLHHLYSIIRAYEEQLQQELQLVALKQYNNTDWV